MEPIVLTFPREPKEAQPEDATCPMCNRDFLADEDYYDFPIQLPCGCVHHFACIEFWFMAEATNSEIIQLSCFNCDHVIDHDLIFNDDTEIVEPYLAFSYNHENESMVVVVTLVIARSLLGTVDPKDTTFVNPHAQSR